MSRAPRLSQTITWSHVPRLGMNRAAKLGFFTALGLLQSVATGGSGGAGVIATEDEIDPRIDSDSYGHVLVGGGGPAMPAASFGPQLGTVRRDRLTITPRWAEMDLPVSGLRLQGAQHLGPWWRPKKAVEARWTLLVNDEEYNLTIEGPWVLLAHLGTLPNWAEPFAD
ncbi:hypothetical protein [Ornithinimicrobium flavum]|uniref:hypothetical protein n=1 Tax=Ornithinimicrobium flavum TaxID=1288636 RepID=UPI00106F5102|nr:hypothetical protein [Ornithinimicrobium flavum]